MWPFTRKQPAPLPEAGASVPQVHFDWKQVPAIQRTAGRHPLTVQTAPFAGGLATHADPRAVAEPLGHHVTLEAPPGLILDFVRPQTRNQGPELIQRSHASHQRPVQRTRTESAAPDVEEAPMLPTFDEVTTHGDEPIRRLPASPEVRPALSLMRVSSETELTPLPSRFETPAPIDHPAETVTHVAPETDSAPEPAYPRLTLGQVRRLGLGAPIARVPETASTVQRSRASDEVPRHAEPLPAPEAAVETPAPAEAPHFQPFALDYLITKEAPPPAPTPFSRRQRIGPALSVSRSAEQDTIVDQRPAPESEGPEKSEEPSPSGSTASAAIQRQAVEDEAKPAPPLQRTSDGPAPVQDADEPTSDGADEAPLQRSHTVELAGATPMVETSASPLLSAPTSGEAAEGPGAELPALPLAAATAVPALQRQAITADEPAGDDREIAPLVSAAPAMATLEPHQGVSEMEPNAATLGAEPTARPTALNELIHRSASTSGASMQFPTPTRTPSLPVAQRLTTSTATDPANAGGVQRTTEGASPTRPIAPASTLPLMSRAILGSASVEPERALPTAASPAMEPFREMHRAAPAAAIQRAADPESALPLAPVMRAHQDVASPPRVSSTEGGAPPQFFFADSTFEATQLPNLPAAIQRSASQDWSLQTAPADSPAVASPAAAHPAAEGTADHTDLDALATKLYDRIRGKLRHELLIDRERAGMLTDLR